MKLLGILQRGPKRSEKKDSSPFRRSRQKPLKAPQLPSVSNSSVISIPAGYDENTIDANTLFEWSVADNAPSAGSAADLFQIHTEVKKNGQHSHPKKKKRHVRKDQGGYASSSDEEEDDIDDDDENHLQNFQYCKLSDSPPHKGSMNMEGTPVRKGEGLFRRNCNLGTPTRAQIGNQWNNFKTKDPIPCPIQMRKTESSKSERSLGPIDVDAFMEAEEVEVCMTSTGETNVVASVKKRDIIERKLSAELKGRIHAVNFDDDNNDGLESSFEECNDSGTPCSASSMDDASVKNVGNPNSPFYCKGRGSTKLVDMSVFSSTRNLGDTNTNVDPMKMFQKELSPAEPEFTFSISEEDIFGSDGDSLIASAWLLHDGDGPNVSNSAGGDKLQKKGQWELDRLQLDIQRGTSTRTVMTEGAVAGDFVTPTTVDSSVSSTVGFGKKVKKQMKNKFQSIVKKKNKGHGSASSGTNSKSNKIDKLKLQRHISEASMAPLTGIEDQTKLRLGKSRKDKDLSKEAERRKEIERRDIERKQQGKKNNLEQLKMVKQREMGAEKWKAIANAKGRKNTPGILAIDPSESLERLKHKTAGVLAIDPSESLERLKKKRTLQSWVKGMPNGSMDSAIQDSQLKSIYAEPQVNLTSRQLEKREHHSYLPAVYDEQSDATGKTSHTRSTARIDNTTKANMNTSDLTTTSTYDFDPQFPDEDSTAQTPEASAPITQDFSCVLCKSGERTHLAVPCMHFSFCGECVNRLEQGSMRCTVCNEETTKFSKVFY